ncbi:hypothetical protein ACH474_25170 [Nocardia rhamnosiphila]|uniref:hypothetical protein n=1 Tax=Nocardia rhamnosiphila TaxID=426716 RepID=UPI0037A16415
MADTALGWLLVAAGTLCIAVKETREFVEDLGWAQGWTWLLAVVAVGNAALQTARTPQVLEAAAHVGDPGAAS